VADLLGNKTGGRTAGTPNKKNQEIQELAKELGCNPAKVLMLIMLGDKEALGEEKDIDLDMKKDAAESLMPYLYGKRKPVDSDGDDKGDPITELVNAFRNK